jgi:flagellar biosynthesis protein FlhF
MRVRKFIGSNSRACLREVRGALGADAVILSTRDVAGGVEILAVAERDMAAIVAPSPEQPTAPPTIRPWQPEGLTKNNAATATRPTPPPAAAPITQFPEVVPNDSVATEIQSIKQMLERQLAGLAKQADTPAGGELAAEIKSMRGLLEQQLAVLGQAAAAQKALAMQARMNEAAVAATQAKVAEQSGLADEVKSMRAFLQRELRELVWGEAMRRSPVHTDVHRRLLGAGYGGALARGIVAELSPNVALHSAQSWLQDALERRFTLAPEDEIVRRGGVYALVGPTGVGKTTTAAKLAARCAIRVGARRIALITTDGYRIGGHDQLRIYGKILGVPVQSAQDAESLAALVASLHERHLVLIDTIGTGQRDPRLAEMLAALDSAGAKRLLLLNAASQAETLEDVVQAWQSERLAGCIVTKIDEAVKLGPALDCLARHALPLHYIANGQRVPEDLHVPNLRYLVHRSLRATTTAALALADEEYALAATAPVAQHASA